MRIKSPQLKTQLSDKLAGIYFVFGAEILLIEQSVTQIKSAAKAQGFDDKISFEIDANFDWSQIFAEIATVNLFSPKRLIECRLKTGKIGIKGSKALSEIVSTLPEDVLLLVSTNKLDSAQQKSKWFKTLEQQGIVLQHWAIDSAHLVGWIANYMESLGLSTNTQVAQHIAFCTEGNLLAAMQEIQKLQMAYPDGKIDQAEYLEQLNQQSQYSIYNLIDAALLGNNQQVNKIYQILITENATPIKLSNALYYEIKTLIGMAIELRHSKDINSILQTHRVWHNRKPVISNALKHLSYPHLQKMLLSLGRIDRSIKGMDNLNVADGLRTLLLTLAGKTQWT